MPFLDLASRQPIVLGPGVQIRTVWGERVMMSFVDFEPHAEVPLHSHPHEQMGMGLLGTFELTIGDETRRIEAGDTYLVPPGVPHRALALDAPARALDIFSPPREDYMV